jgi:hypothetical protein
VSQSPSIEGPTRDFATADLLRRTEPTAYSVSPEEGLRLVKAFLGISSPERRLTVLEYVADMAKMDAAERTQV